MLIVFNGRMALELCKNCGRMHYATDKCRVKTHPSLTNYLTDDDAFDPVPIIKAEMKRRGRPPTGFDKKAYDRQKAAARRAAGKAK